MNQHYVPRSYLKHFADSKGKEFFVDVYDKNENRFFHTNIKNICSEIDLYTLQKDNPITQDLFAIERIYSNGLEPLYIKAYEILTNQSIGVISQVQRVEILLGIFQLFVRNPILIKNSISIHKREILKLFKESKRKGLKGITYLSEDFSFREWTEEKIILFFENKMKTEFKEKHVGGIGEIGAFHEHAIFDVCVIKDNSEFITSDNPLVLEDLVSDNKHPLARSIEFTIALNKKVALQLYHDNSKQLNRIYRHFIPNGSVEMVNNVILNQANRFIISSKDVLTKHNKFYTDWLANTSLDLKIDLIRQVLTKIPTTLENKIAREIMQKYLNKFDNEGGLSDNEVYALHLDLQKLKIDFINKRIN